ncbi:MAG: arsenate reductase ArsC [Candidatus Hadarchaeota archaeon]
MKRVLFVCVGNSFRSQIAEAFFNSMAKNARASSAGTRNADKVSSTAIMLMKEVGIDMSGAKPKLLTPEMLDEADIVISMGCQVGELCPGVLADEDWGLDDPLGKPVEKAREIRDAIKEKVERLAAKLSLE